MPQINTTTSNVKTTLAATINAYRAKFVKGIKISYADIVNVMNLYNTWLTHTHTVADRLWIAFGNTSPYGTTTEVRTTAAPTGIGLAALAPMADPGKIPISPAYQNQATNAINATPATTHSHPIIDSYYS